MQHIEFFHTDHFESNYHRVKPSPALSGFIDFFWQTKFETLWEKYPGGFSDALFPNIGYTYLLNLGTPFIMQVGEKSFEMKTDGFLPRHRAIECYHQPGNDIFGIKFKISPVIFKKKINFSEYREFIYPLSYLMEQAVIDKAKKADCFNDRVIILSEYFQSITEKHSWEPIRIVSEILQHCDSKNDFITPVEDFAAKYGISARTLQRYFEHTTSLSSKQALQIMRIRKAAEHLVNSPSDFNSTIYGYYDHSHFYKHLRQFLKKETVKSLQPHLKLLSKLHKVNSNYHQPISTQ